MIYTMIAYYDKDLKSYTSLQAINSNDPLQIAADVRKGLLKQLPKDKIAGFAHKAMWKLGMYDDDTGLLTECVPEELLDCDILLQERMKIEKSLDELKAYAEGN